MKKESGCVCVWVSWLPTCLLEAQISEDYSAETQIR